jgi:hypothetical protein
VTSDYVDNWDSLPPPVQDALMPVIVRFDEAADLLFDRRLNLSFEAAVVELSIPGIVALTDALRQLGQLLTSRVQVVDPAEGVLFFDDALTLTAYDLPLYAPCLYLSQLAQAMDTENVRVWKDSTAEEIVCVLLVMARYIRPDIEAARVCIAAIHDMVYLYPQADAVLRSENRFPNAAHIAATARHLLSRR